MAALRKGMTTALRANRPTPSYRLNILGRTLVSEYSQITISSKNFAMMSTSD